MPAHSAQANYELDGTHRVITPEYVEFDFVLAGMMSRFLAWLCDTIVCLVVAMVTLSILSTVMALFPGFNSALSFVVWFLIDWGYMIVFELWWSGQTPGKRLTSLRVIQETGVRVSFYQTILRNLARPVDRLPLFYLVGGAVALLSKKHQRLGDMLAGTLVVRDRRIKIPASVATPQGLDVALLSDSEFSSRVARISSEEEQLLISAVLRREEMSVEARLKFFAKAAARLEQELGFSKPEHLSDEKVVLLVCAAIARRKAAGKKS
jgi:uncharacterized RDD family membrane protein YckC